MSAHGTREERAFRDVAIQSPDPASAPYDRGVKIRPLGWELTTALVAVAALVAAIFLGFEDVTLAVLVSLAVITPLVLLSAGARLVAGIVRENRRYRHTKTAGPEGSPARYAA